MPEDTGKPSAQPNDYTSHKEQIEASGPSAERIAGLQDGLLKAYERVISYREVAVISFEDFTADELAQAFVSFPIILKPTLACVNVAGRALKRDLGLKINTYATKISADHARILAGYLKPLLPPEIAVPVLLELDRYAWTDKVMRLTKGQWEKDLTKAINAASKRAFKKRRFKVGDQVFELDIAYPATGDAIDIGIDVKRIEAVQDTQKRADEIVNKAAKFKSIYPDSKFYALVYYPFTSQHANLLSRLKGPHIDGVYFAGATPSSIAGPIGLLCSALGFASAASDTIALEFDDAEEDDSGD